ncbi:MAG: Gfo/Idh/MocA family protein [Candidatus Sumerlaeia bacterium]
MISKIRAAIVGCGAFSRFAMQAFMKCDQIELVATAEPNPDAAAKSREICDLPNFESLDQMLKTAGFDLLYIATPPFLHYEQASAALKAGKHVICEKPLTIKYKQSRELIDLAEEKDRLMVTNLMQRYNPLYHKVKELIDSNVLGEFLFGHFENLAQDEELGPNHWFWDPEKSGGIFVEHGVHFFDMFEGWFGEGHLLSAQSIGRPEGPGETHVYCTMHYKPRGLVHFYHGFHQAERMDRQEFRLVFERGEIRLYEWVPTSLQIDTLISRDNVQKIESILPDCTLKTLETLEGVARNRRSYHKLYEVDLRGHIHWDVGLDKESLYSRMLLDMIEDQALYIRDNSRQRIITEQNGLDAVKTAAKARRLADGMKQIERIDHD